MCIRAKLLLYQVLIDYAPLGVLSNEVVVVSGVKRPTLTYNIVLRVSLRY